jgi:uridylate kinase
MAAHLFKMGNRSFFRRQGRIMSEGTSSDNGGCGKSGYKRIVLKVTGESLSGVGGKGLDQEHILHLADKIIQTVKLGLQVAVVVGGGNILRGANLSGSKLIRPFAAHQMGMIATTINGMALTETLNSLGRKARLFSAFNVGSIIEPYSVIAARESLDDGKVVVLAGGTGSPYVTTDTCAAIRAAELGADAIFKATKVDGIYTADPIKDPHAKRIDTISYDEFINRRLMVLDLTAVRICQEAGTPVVVFNFKDLDNLDRVLEGKIPSSVIRD